MRPPTGPRCTTTCFAGISISGRRRLAPTRCVGRQRPMPWKTSSTRWPSRVRRCTSTASGCAAPGATAPSIISSKPCAAARGSAWSRPGPAPKGRPSRSWWRIWSLPGGSSPSTPPAPRRPWPRRSVAVEPNQRSLLDAMRPAFDQTTGPAHTTKDRGHGRHETRRARTLTDPKIVARVSAAARIEGIRGLCRIERTRITQDGIVTTVHYHISSRALTPRQYARGTRSHWSVEVLHFVLDGALDEDACRIGTAAAAVGALRQLAYSVIADLRGALSFGGSAEGMGANPARLLEICAACR